MRVRLWMSALLLLFVPRGMVCAQLIVNGGFETPNIGAAPFSTVAVGGEPVGFGWTVTTGDVDVVGPATSGPAYAGIQYLDLNGANPGAVSQTFATTAGAAYQFTFVYANNYIWTTVGSPGLATARAFDAGTGLDLVAPLVLSHGNSTPANLDWTNASLPFVATGPSTTIRFTSNSPGGGGIFIDSVSVIGPPPPPIPPSGGGGNGEGSYSGSGGPPGNGPGGKGASASAVEHCAGTGRCPSSAGRIASAMARSVGLSMGRTARRRRQLPWTRTPA